MSALPDTFDPTVKGTRLNPSTYGQRTAARIRLRELCDEVAERNCSAGPAYGERCEALSLDLEGFLLDQLGEFTASAVAATSGFYYANGEAALSASAGEDS